MRNRKFHVRTAISDRQSYDTGQGLQFQNLGELLRHLLGNHRQIQQRTCRHGGKTVEIRHADIVGNLVKIHMVAYTPDDDMSIVPHARDQESADLETSPPPADAEYLDGDLMVLVHDNDVIVCQSAALRESVLPILVEAMARAAGWETHSLTFWLAKRADTDVLERIRREGIDRLDFTAVANQIAVDEIEDSASSTFLTPILSGLRDLAGIEPNVGDDQERLKVYVGFKVDRRHGTRLDQQNITAAANHIINTEDGGYVIETLAGNKFSADQTELSKEVRLPEDGKSVQYIAAWNAMEEFLRDLGGNDGG